MGLTVEYRADCNARLRASGTLGHFCCASRRGIAGGTIYLRGARTKLRCYHYRHLISHRCKCFLRSSQSQGDVKSIPTTTRKPGLYSLILSSWYVDMKEIPPNNRHHEMCWSNQQATFLTAPMVIWRRKWRIGPILEMHISDQIHILNVLAEVVYSTGNAP